MLSRMFTWQRNLAAAAGLAPAPGRLWYYSARMARRRPSKRIFTYDEALATFPLVRDLTAAAVRQVEALDGKLRGGEEEEDPRRREVERARDRIVEAWAREVSSIGCEVKGVWLVDWDSGDGYYCWQFPEQAIGFFHTYDEGFAGRIPIN
jgi:hypothetical protein